MDFHGVLWKHRGSDFFPEDNSEPQNETFLERNFEDWERKAYHADDERA